MQRPASKVTRARESTPEKHQGALGLWFSLYILPYLAVGPRFFPFESLLAGP